MHNKQNELDLNKMFPILIFIRTRTIPVEIQVIKFDMWEMAMLVTTVGPISAEAMTTVPILQYIAEHIWYMSWSYMKYHSLHCVRCIHSSEKSWGNLPVLCYAGLFSASSVNFANFTSCDVRRRLSSHSTYLILMTRSTANLKVVHSWSLHSNK